MRTTITLTPEAETLVRRTMLHRGLSFKDAVNEAIVVGLTAGHERQPVSTPTFDLGRTRVPVEQALRLAGELEDEELLRKRAMGK
ncbi:MAG: antitoxin [Ornithinimicrobium sp.]|uniref:antitoxin n=1 Tax=Ornithinimicrobium sp. TaxID=1977084 RepID=UPI0017AFE4E4|nr:antitoxin [Actinomycetota bacterium]